MNDSQIYARVAAEAVEFGNAVPGSVKPIAFSNRYTENREVFTNGYGIHWFDEMKLSWYRPDYFEAYIGTIAISCKEIGREKDCDWHHLYGITIDGRWVLWAC